MKVIESLAREAGWDPSLPPYGKFSQYDKFDHEKFAELMIKEFETLAKNPRWYFPEQQDGWREPINCICKEMNKHFEVDHG